MSRFAPERVERPDKGIADSPGLCEAYADWCAARRSLDGEIADWAAGLDEGELAGTLGWYSGALGREVSKPLALCVTHMFNHQTHHRGQVHAMLTKEGLKAPVSDLFAMPEGA
ncbi:MAG: DinB family protein [Pseudomonadota bacterium]|uniref:DinB family protein n=1 Tax=Roseovarius TaxID=74030 RepID=UPI002E1A9A15